uniref:Uncharacterized protein n=1 Tax=Solanum lycopersicum TaxID=4081 RepID=A0A3Q7G403_SOLLC
MVTFAKSKNSLKRAEGNKFCNHLALVMVRENLRKLCFFGSIIRMIKLSKTEMHLTST